MNAALPQPQQGYNPFLDPALNNAPDAVPNAPNAGALVPVPNAGAIVPVPNAGALVPVPNAPDAGAIVPVPNAGAIVPRSRSPAAHTRQTRGMRRLAQAKERSSSPDVNALAQRLDAMNRRFDDEMDIS
jgi:hypothetical protein